MHPEKLRKTRGQLPEGLCAFPENILHFTLNFAGVRH